MLSARKRAEVRRHFRVLRTSAELSQIDAALKAKLSFYRYRLIELGYEIATDEERAELAKVLKTVPEQLYPPEVTA
jgi:hypothetical protein